MKVPLMFTVSKGLYISPVAMIRDCETYKWLMPSVMSRDTRASANPFTFSFFIIAVIDCITHNTLQQHTTHFSITQHTSATHFSNTLQQHTSATHNTLSATHFSNTQHTSATHNTPQQHATKLQQVTSKTQHIHQHTSATHKIHQQHTYQHTSATHNTLQQHTSYIHILF